MEKLKNLKVFFVFDYDEEEFNELIKLKPSDDLITIKEGKAEQEKRKYKIELNNKALVILNLLIFIILLLMIYNFYEINKLSELRDEHLRDLSFIKEDTKNLNERLNNYILETELRTKGSIITEKPKIEPVQEKITADTSAKKTGTVGNTENKVKEEKIAVTPENVSTKKYTVKNGDTLEKIAINQYKNRAGIEVIMKVNKLKDRADIKIGQVLEIPEKLE